MAGDGLRSRRGVSSPPYTNNPYYSYMDVTHYGRQTLNPNRFNLIENFNQLPSINASIGIAVNRNFEVLGANASADDVTFSSHVGGILLETDGADNDQVIIAPHLDAGQTAWTGVKWGTENQIIWEAVIRSADVSNTTFWAGLKLTNTSVIATDDDQAFFRVERGVSNANIQCVYSVGGTDASIDSGVLFNYNTTYELRIEIDSDRKAHFFINDIEVGVSAALTNDKDLIPYIGVHANTAAERALCVMKTAISRIIFE